MATKRRAVTEQVIFEIGLESDELRIFRARPGDMSMNGDLDEITRDEAKDGDLVIAVELSERGEANPRLFHLSICKIMDAKNRRAECNLIVGGGGTSEHVKDRLLGFLGITPTDQD
jgi:hypothetical protein